MEGYKQSFLIPEAVKAFEGYREQGVVLPPAGKPMSLMGMALEAGLDMAMEARAQGRLAPTEVAPMARTIMYEVLKAEYSDNQGNVI